MSDGAPDAVVIALGNRHRGDDAVGPELAARLDGRLPGCRVVSGPLDALALVAAWDGARVAVVVDAARGGDAAPGTVHRLDAGDAAAAVRAKAITRCSSHGGGLAEALALAELLGRLPRRLVVLAVEAERFDAGSPLSPAVAAAIEPLAGEIVRAVAPAEADPHAADAPDAGRGRRGGGSRKTRHATDDAASGDARAGIDRSVAKGEPPCMKPR